MNICVHFLLIIVVWENTNACSHYDDPACKDFGPFDRPHHKNQWIVEIDGDEETAKSVAKENGFQYLKPVKDHENHYLFLHPDVPSIHEMQHETFTDMLRSHHKVKRAGQQYVYKPTLHELDEYDAFVGHDGHAKVTVSTLDPEERIEYYDNLKNERNIPSYEGEENINEEREPNQQPELLQPLHNIFKLEKMYEYKKQKTSTSMMPNAQETDKKTN